MRKKRGYLRSLERKQQVSGKRIVGIDPAKENHHAVVLDEYRMQKGKSFSFQSSYEGYNETLSQSSHRNADLKLVSVPGCSLK